MAGLEVAGVVGADWETRRPSATGPANAPTHHCQRSQEPIATVRKRMTTVSATTLSFDLRWFGNNANQCAEHAFGKYDLTLEHVFPFVNVRVISGDDR